MDKAFYQSKTVISGVVYAAVGVLEVLGVSGDWSDILQMLAVAGVIYGIRDAL